MNTNANPAPLRRSIDTKKRRARPFRLWGIVFLLVCVAGFGLYLPDGLHYQTQESTHTQGLPVSEASVPAVATSLQHINAWADVSENMLGFVALPRATCIPSLYRDMLQNLPALLDGQSAAPMVDWHIFSNSYSEALENGSPADAQYYVNRQRSRVTTTGILPALQSVAEGVPTVIFTDLEQSPTTDYLSDVQQAMKALFDQGYTVRIDRFISAFGGKISNFAGQGGVFLYGQEQREKKSIPQVQIWKTGNHHQPRPFFVITVGSALQCQSVGEALAARLQDFYTAETVQDMNSHRDLDLPLYQVHNVFLLEVPLPLSLPTLRTSEAAGVTSLPLSAAITRQAAGAPGVQGYALDREAAGGEAGIRFTLTPAIARLGKDYQMLWDQQSLTCQIVGTTPTRVFDQAQATLYLQARGPRYLKMALAPFQSENNAFVFKSNSAPANPVEIDFTIATTNLPKGLYRIDLRLYAKPNVSLNRLPYGQNVSQYAFTKDEALAIATQIAKGREFATAPLLRTYGLIALEQAIRRAFTEAEETRTVLMGQIAFDLRVQ